MQCTVQSGGERGNLRPPPYSLSAACCRKRASPILPSRSILAYQAFQVYYRIAQVSTIQVYYRHLGIHNGETKFKCNFCPKAYLTKSSLANHKVASHQDTKKRGERRSVG